MLFTSHSTVGAALGVATGNPVVGFFAGVISHHVLDAVPHFDQGTFYTVIAGPPYLGRKREPEHMHGFNRRDWNMLFIDWAVAAVIFSVIFYVTPATSWSLVFWGALGGLMPDIIDSSPLWSRKLREKIKLNALYHQFHSHFHWTVERTKIFLGVITQVIAVSLALVYLLS